MLLIGETPDFATQVGGVTLISTGTNLQIKIDANGVMQRGLTISSRLLKLSQIVGE